MISRERHEGFENLRRSGKHSDVRIASRQMSKAAELAERHPDTVAVPSAKEAVEGADIVCGCTDASGPVPCVGYEQPGLSVNAISHSVERDLCDSRLGTDPSDCLSYTSPRRKASKEAASLACSASRASRRPTSFAARRL